jgi:hypothetical protein
MNNCFPTHRFESYRVCTGFSSVSGKDQGAQVPGTKPDHLFHTVQLQQVQDLVDGPCPGATGAQSSNPHLPTAQLYGAFPLVDPLKQIHLEFIHIIELKVKVNYQPQGLLYPCACRDFHCLVPALGL